MGQGRSIALCTGFTLSRLQTDALVMRRYRFEKFYEIVVQMEFHEPLVAAGQTSDGSFIEPIQNTQFRRMMEHVMAGFVHAPFNFVP